MKNDKDYSVDEEMSSIIKNGRISAKLTQSKMAKKIGISRSTYGEWERRAGKIPITKMEKILSIIKVKMDWTFQDKNTQINESICKKCEKIGCPAKGFGYGYFRIKFFGEHVLDECPYIVEHVVSKTHE